MPRYGIPSRSVDSIEADAIIERFLLGDVPALLEVKQEQITCVNPKLVVNLLFEDMSLHLERDELAKEMLIELADEEDVPK